MNKIIKAMCGVQLTTSANDCVKDTLSPRQAQKLLQAALDATTSDPPYDYRSRYHQLIMAIEEGGNLEEDVIDLSDDGYSSPKKKTTPNPNPYRFKIRRFEEYGKYLLALVNYPDCTTFGGDKLMVLEMSAEELMNRSKLDPHFFYDGYVIARFPPTVKGIQWAKDFLEQR